MLTRVHAVVAIKVVEVVADPKVPSRGRNTEHERNQCESRTNQSRTESMSVCDTGPIRVTTSTNLHSERNRNDKERNETRIHEPSSSSPPPTSSAWNAVCGIYCTSL